MKKILIVEDEPDYVQLLRVKLGKSYQILEAQNGKSGLEMAKKHQPDLILLDNMMPEMDGMTMLSELRKDSYGKSAKVIILSNLDANDAILEQTVKSQPTYYFIKFSISLSELLDKINELLGEKKTNSQIK